MYRWNGSLISCILLIGISTARNPDISMIVPQIKSVKLVWRQPPMMDYINEYVINYRSIGECSNIPSGVECISGQSTMYEIMNLEENTTYEINITAINAVSNRTRTIMTTTLPARPDGRVHQLETQFVDFTRIAIIWQPLNCTQRNGIITGYNISYNDSSYTLISANSGLMFNANNLYPGILYTFKIAAVNTIGSGPYTSLNVSTSSPNDVGLLHGVSYSTHSLIDSSDIGQNENALFCFMKNYECCRSLHSNNTRGIWYYPNNSMVGGRNKGSFFRTRTPSSIVLHYNQQLEANGIFRCTVTNFTAYFGIYKNSTGRAIITSVTYNMTSGVLTCISTGGPATTVTWSRSDHFYHQTKRVVNAVSATYHNFLIITSPTISDYLGNFTCTVINIRGNYSLTAGEYKGLTIVGDSNFYTEGSSANITCSSNFTVNSIRWLTPLSDINYTTLRQAPGELILQIYNISMTIRGKTFVCEVTFSITNSSLSENFTLNIDETKSGPVIELIITSVNSSNILIYWSPPDEPNGIITNYFIRVFDIKRNNLKNVSINATHSNYSISDLEAGIPYNISVVPVNSKGEGRFSSKIIFSEELAPAISPNITMAKRISGSSILVSWTLLTLVQSRGFIENYIIIYNTTLEEKDQSLPMIQKFDNNTSNSIIMNLDEESSYYVQVSATTKRGSAQSLPVLVPKLNKSKTSEEDVITMNTVDDQNSSTVSIVVGLILGVLLIIGSISLIYLYIKWKKRNEFKKQKCITSVNEYRMSENDLAHKSLETSVKYKNTLKDDDQDTSINETSEQMYENTATLVKNRKKSISLEDFGAHVSRMHADRDKWFEMEFNSMEKSSTSDCDVALIPENRARNRFGNIYPYNFNRVVLNELPDVKYSDYINASYVDGYDRNKVYIAAQGPMVNSIDDFWRMIWENKVPTIVMLTKVFEGKKKCEEYWPQSTSSPFIPTTESAFVINLVTILPYPEFVIKNMIISKKHEPDSPTFEVTLFHYLGWPDHGVPANATSMINFIKRVRKDHSYSKEDLMVVHCSAGVGRTGTFITLDYMLERIKTEKSINIYEFVNNLRKQRVHMVQTMAQYIFIHNALEELLTCGDTEIAAADMRINIGKFCRPAEGAYISGFQKQYETLKKVTNDVLSINFSESVNAVNADKNRYDNKIPFNHTRVHLRSAAAHGSDYINASFVEGYRQKGAYIATQGPLPQTVNDFWRMIWEYECRCIVMLCRSEENGKEVSHRYWPQGKGNTETYGKLTVALKDQKIISEYVMRKLDVYEEQSRMSVMPASCSITQFHYLKWPEENVPNTTSTLLEIAHLVQKVQMSTGNKPIIVMCNDGVGRSGTFITIHAQMERMKAEAVVDIFQFIKSVRFQRAGLVANKEQYEFCHHVLADFLDGFETYANFKQLI